jgi:hypothetical protein
MTFTLFYSSSRTSGFPDIYNSTIFDIMETQATPQPATQPPTLESVFAFLRTDEWKVLVDVLEYNIRDGRKKNLQKAAPFWTMCPPRQAILLEHTKMEWQSTIQRLQNITELMRELPEYIASQDHYYIRAKCDGITETIVLIVNDYTSMHAKFTKYLHDNEYDTVKMKFFRQGPNGWSGGKFVKYGQLFGGVQSLSLWSFLHRIYEVFLLPWDEAIDQYPPRRLHTWPDAAAIPENFRYRVRERIPARHVETPIGDNQWELNAVAIPLQRDDRLEEHGMRSDSSGEERHDNIDSDGVVRDVRDSVCTWHFGNDSDHELDPVVEDAHRVVRLSGPEPEPDSDDDGAVAGSRVPPNHPSVHTAPESDDDRKNKIHGSWGKCLRAGFRTPVEVKRGRWADQPPDWGQ